MQQRLRLQRNRWLSALLGMVLLALSLWSLGRALSETPPLEIWHSLRSIPRASIALAGILTGANYGVLTLYDSLAVRYARQTLSYGKTAVTAIVGYALSNNIGFSILSGGAIRYRFYSRWGMPVGAIARLMLFLSLCFWVGLCAVGGGLFWFAPRWVSELLHLPLRLVQLMGAGGLGLLLGHLGWSAWGDRAGGRSLRLGQWVLPGMSLRLALGQLAATLADWATVAAILYVLLPREFLPSYPLFLGAYLLAKVATVVSNVPGGLGVFETVLMLTLAWPPAAVAQFVGAMLAYRALYYLMPLLVGIGLFGLVEWYWIGRNKHKSP